MPEIPINPMDLPTETEPLDDSLTYTGTIVKVGEGTDKNGDAYISIQAEIEDPLDLKGRKLSDNYIRLPQAVTATMDAKQRKAAMESGVRLGRLCRSAQFKPGDRSWHTDELVGHEIRFTVKNEEYQGRLIPKINEYLFSEV
jgi:hypothetical protein